jgi:hypothetical protein
VVQIYRFFFNNKTIKLFLPAASQHQSGCYSDFDWFFRASDVMEQTGKRSRLVLL